MHTWMGAEPSLGAAECVSKVTAESRHIQADSALKAEWEFSRVGKVGEAGELKGQHQGERHRDGENSLCQWDQHGGPLPAAQKYEAKSANRGRPQALRRSWLLS